ncbi:MAG: hypothetical protein J0J06_15740 [Sphingomonas sp.]|nr:hypothetical protein [Sphingomonas sp.]
MFMFALLALSLSSSVIPAVDEPCLQRRDQDRAFEARKQGRILPLPEIERRVIPTMAGAQYLGPEVDFDSGVYTLKFLRNGTVIWVRVDGRSGQIIGRTGN